MDMKAMRSAAACVIQILGRIPNDWDITTSATPQQVKKLFLRTVDTGIQHGTVTVLMGKEGYEVTTYRVDGEYEDARHPKEVTFTANLEEDLRRRDFTINAMAYNDSEGLVDVFGGRADIEQKVIRCVGNAEERFGEDALRIMRAVRFSAQLGFTVDPDTAEAAKKLAGTLSKISAERIQTELVKLLVSPHPDYLRYAWEYGITAVVLPEFDRTMETPQNNPHHCYNVGEHTLEALRNIEADKTLRLAALFHDFGKPQTHTTDADGIDHFHGHAKISAELANNIMHRLKFDNDTLNKVKVYVRYHDLRPELTEKSVRRAVSKVGADAFAEDSETENGRYPGSVPEVAAGEESLFKRADSPVSHHFRETAVPLHQRSEDQRKRSDRRRHEAGQRDGRDPCKAAGAGIRGAAAK